MVFFNSGFCVGKLNFPIEIDGDVSEIPLIVDKLFIGTSFEGDSAWVTLTVIVVFETGDGADEFTNDGDAIGFVVVFDENVLDFDVDGCRLDLNLTVELKLDFVDFFVDDFDEELAPIKLLLVLVYVVEVDFARV